MKRFSFALCLVLTLSFFGITSIFAAENLVSGKAPQELKVMSFNIWVGGGKSLQRTFEIIQETGAEIVGIQESNKDGQNVVRKFAQEHGGWHVCTAGGSCSILSRYPMETASENGHGVKIKIDDNRFVWMFNLHLSHCPYQPYQLSGIEYCGAPFLNTAGEAIESAWKARGPVVEKVLEDLKNAKKDQCPIFLTGDFNEPSHLDWTKNAAKEGICKMPVEWPATKALQEKGGLKDSYRTKYPDEVKHKGHTWTPLPSEKDVLDRIDFLLFHGKGVQVKTVQIVGEKSELSDVGFDRYPSDHRAVLGTFLLP